jgi:hypothetical protein
VHLGRLSGVSDVYRRHAIALACDIACETTIARSYLKKSNRWSMMAQKIPYYMLEALCRIECSFHRVVW